MSSWEGSLPFEAEDTPEDDDDFTLVLPHNITEHDLGLIEDAWLENLMGDRV
jgi:hypothetical protein